jgi:hypothetical protein
LATGRITAVEVTASGVHHYAIELENGVVESFPSYLVEPIPQKGLVERLRARRLTLPILVAAGTLVTAGATLGVVVAARFSDALGAATGAPGDVYSRAVGEEPRRHERVDSGCSSGAR